MSLESHIADVMPSAFYREEISCLLLLTDRETARRSNVAELMALGGLHAKLSSMMEQATAAPRVAS